MKTSGLFIAAASMASLSQGALMVRNAPIEGYTVVPMEWTGKAHPDKPEVTIKGTVQEVMSQILKVNPDYVLSTIENDSSLGARDLEERNKRNVICNISGSNGGECETISIMQGIDYLNGLDGVCYVAGGPRVCARISCSYDAPIWLCNDITYPIQPSCRYLATYAVDILHVCADVTVSPGSRGWGLWPQWDNRVKGQEFNTDNYNVIVGVDAC